ncbi:MAG: DUF3368 domain-containing protein [Brachymonas sp.]|nr:DUF3368 domain-containing protein [Brachymonas sp.]NJS35712.1 DUF3368 domain-containing protein [Brachymonas sp.]
MSSRIIVADASPLIGLAKCQQLPLLMRMFEAVHVPQRVVIEVTAPDKPLAAEISLFIQNHAIVEADRDSELSEKLKRRLDAGEIQALCCAQDLKCPVLIDERKGRLIAQAHGIEIMGSLGLLLSAKRDGHLERIKPSIEQLREYGYLLGDELIAHVLRLACER